ncbi:hypothetical protein EWM64_g5181 [Hericium alpestre]|uniref:Uncharacterized protein n=1 Tax=Hericium alpestre TaxID=135208 RepID=A0A4Y9ZY26_9AGAM|nr:hypothetical protein EWM64_g5181 [Hericium alpestre]
MREPPTSMQQACADHMVNTIPLHRAASPTQLCTTTELVHEHMPPTATVFEPAESAAVDACADMSVAIAMLQVHVAHMFEPCPKPDHSPPTSNMHIAPRNYVPAFSAPATAAIAHLVLAIDFTGLPDSFYASPAPVLDHNDLWFTMTEAPPPHTIVRLAKSIHEIDKALLEEICEEVRREVRREMRSEVRVEVHQHEQAWKDGYKQGQWEGYREGLDTACAEVSASPQVDMSIQADVSNPLHSPSTDTTPMTSRVDAHIQTNNIPCTHTPPTYARTTASYIDASMQFDALPHPLPLHADSHPPHSHRHIHHSTTHRHRCAV